MPAPHNGQTSGFDALTDIPALVLAHRLEERQHQRGVIQIRFHSGERASEISVARPLRAVALNLADQSTQVVDPLEQLSGVSFADDSCHRTCGILATSDVREKRRFG